jgi:hypothetical protein
MALMGHDGPAHFKIADEKPDPGIIVLSEQNIYPPGSTNYLNFLILIL